LAVPKPQVSWYKNGELIKPDERIQIPDGKGGIYQLSIKNSKKDDTGVYVCKAKNEIGEAECTAQLVIEMAPQFLKKLEKLEAVESCEAEWMFQLVGIPKPTIEFSRNGEKIDFAKDNNYSIEELEDHLYYLKIKDVKSKDVGNWTCTASNTAGKASCIAKLETLPLSPPKFVKELKDCRLPQDVTNKLEVKVTGIPFPQIEWYKDGVKINFDTQSNKYKQEKDMRTGTLALIIENSSPTVDSGLYKARIYNPGGECSSEAKVVVKGFAPRFVEKPEKIYALANDVATFATIVDGDPKPIVTWSKGRTQLNDSGEIKIYYDEQADAHFMEIANCKSKDAGTYQVTATNEFGEITAPVTLIITQNPEDVVDLKQMLKNRGGKRRSIEDEGPDWGKLRKGSQKPKPDDDDADKIKLRHVEFEKPKTEEVKEEKPKPVINYILRIKFRLKLLKM
jgi:hypothetical protein